MKLYEKNIDVIRYDISKWDFRGLIAEMLEVSPTDLVRLHEIDKSEFQNLGADQHSKWHKLYYSKQEEKMLPMVKEFVSDFLKEYFGEESLIFQKRPTFRVHEVANLGVGEWHRDRDYNHGPEEMNLWIPFTPAYDTNTVWTESEEGREDFKPMNVSYGEILLFNGANLLHGNHTNQTPTTRVSFDMRVVVPSEFNPSGKDTIYKQQKFELGSYFDQV